MAARPIGRLAAIVALLGCGLAGTGLAQTAPAQPERGTLPESPALRPGGPSAPPDGGPPPERTGAIGPDAGPAQHPPRSDSPQAVNRGTDGSAVGLDTDRNATGTTPQGMLGSATAGDRNPDGSPGSPPPPAPAAPAR
ncbi:MAG TPA: hypothetical protein VD970_09015 [Acetobacteraceae bacterium]|nr:hypothetical protein [Acetobacteraceae bacterium]